MMSAEELKNMEMDAVAAVGTMPYSVEMQTEEQVYYSPTDGRLLAEGEYHYPVVHSKAAASNYTEKSDTLAPSEVAAKRVNTYFERWLTEQRSNFQEISAMAEKNYNCSAGSSDSSWLNPDYHFIDRVYVSTWSNQHMVCLTLWRESFTGGVHGISNRQPVTFDVHTGREITINDMTDDYVGLCGAVEEEILRQIQERQTREVTGYFKDYKEVIRQWISRSVFFDQEGLLVVFGAYDIAPYAAGEQAFQIPYALVEPYLNDYGRGVLELK